MPNDCPAFFKLNPQNVLFWVIAPSLYTRYVYQDDIDKRIKDLWKVHKNRVDRGLGGTYNTTGIHESMELQDSTMLLNNTTLSFGQIFDGLSVKSRLFNPFTRWHEKYNENPDHLNDIDKISFKKVDHYERIKPYRPSADKVIGEMDVIPRKDDEDEPRGPNLLGMNIFVSDADPNLPVFDHGLDEDRVWVMPKDHFLQDTVVNQYTNGVKVHEFTNVPMWSQKLIMQTWYTNEKYRKFIRHWDHRKGLEEIKLMHKIKYPGVPTPEQKDLMRKEIFGYMKDVEDFEEELKLEDLYVTDHKAPTPKYITRNEQELREQFEYEQNLKKYNDVSDSKKLLSFTAPKSKYARGSLQQQIFEPLAFGVQDENGTLEYEIIGKDINYMDLFNEEKLREAYNAQKELSTIDIDEIEDEEELARASNLIEIQSKQLKLQDYESLEKMLNKEFLTFDQNEPYNFTKDLKKAFFHSLRTDTEEKIFEKIPDHYFWDIKRPQVPYYEVRQGQFNPFRGRPYKNFFEMREADQYFHEQEAHRNLNNNVSSHRRY